MQRKTVVLVCMVDSIHVARWIAQFDPTKVKFVLFPSGPSRRVHPKILVSIANGRTFDNQVTVHPFGGKFSVPLWMADRFLSNRVRGFLLARLIRREKPDFVHALEFQNAGYLTTRALMGRQVKATFIATNYGSDIFWFRRFPSHLKKIRKVLSRADMYSAECERDVRLALELGFRGKVLPLFPNAGGFDPRPELLHTRPSSRKVIAVKGYQGWAGRGINTLHALEMLREELKDYQIVVFSASRSVQKMCTSMENTYGMRIKAHKNGTLSHEQVAQILDSARLYIGISVTDGISTSLLEAMRAGAFPIQTRSSCASEWITDGLSGHLVSGPDIQSIASAVSPALAQDELVDEASEINIKTISERAAKIKIATLAKEFYQIT